MDLSTLSRIQFGFTIGFHILFPTLTIGLAWFLVIFEGCWRKTARQHWLDLYQFWVKIFALTFGMGVVSGIVLEYEIGMNFSRFAAFAGPVLGPLLSAEVLTAFFVEAGFLGVMLFGWKRVGPRLHFLASLLVAIGTTNSAFWIISANSWMQTPQGVSIADGHVVPVDWLQIVLNPSFPYRVTHMLLASLLTTSLVVGGVSAYQWRRKGIDYARRGLRIAVFALAVIAPAQILAGDQSGLEVREHQPAKLAAIESIWHTRGDLPFVIFALPDQEAQKNRLSIEIPYAGSLILTHSIHDEVKGFDELPRDQQPPVVPVFFSFRIMVALGFWFLLLGWGGVALLRGARIERHNVYLRALAWSTPLGFVATICGWIVAESGRQPWVVYGMMRTADAISPVPAGAVAGSLATFVLVYGLLFGTYAYFVGRLVRSGPDLPARHPEAMRGARAAEVIPKED